MQNLYESYILIAVVLIFDGLLFPFFAKEMQVAIGRLRVAEGD